MMISNFDLDERADPSMKFWCEMMPLGGWPVLAYIRWKTAVGFCNDVRPGAIQVAQAQIIKKPWDRTDKKYCWHQKPGR